MMLHTMPWWGIKLELTLMRLHATCAESSSVLDNLVLSLNTSGMEDNIENDKENVTKDHEECFKEFTPNMLQTNSVWIRLGSDHAYCSCLSHHEVWLVAAHTLPFFILQINTKKYMRILLHTMPWWGVKLELTLMRLMQHAMNLLLYLIIGFLV